MRIAVLGSTGMLGGMVCRELASDFKISKPKFRVLNDGGSIDKVHMYCSRADVIINCIGAIKPQFRGDITNQIYTNAIFPRELANYGKDKGKLVIHITTDCVFSGIDCGHTEDAPHDPLDAYGKSKSLGEPDNCMVLRTSIIGPEFNGNKRSLIEWLLSNVGGEISGYTNHQWNGVTTLELARCLRKIIKEDLYEDGTFHIHSNDINKFDLLSLMNGMWDLRIKINETKATHRCNRTMRSIKPLNEKLEVRTQKEMARDLLPYILMER
jgi:dTDP-4-dehydrorhamnose reductase